IPDQLALRAVRNDGVNGNDDITLAAAANSTALPPPRNRGLPRLRISNLRKSGRPDLRWGRAGERGSPGQGLSIVRVSRAQIERACRVAPPSLTLPHKGGGNDGASGGRGLNRSRHLPEVTRGCPAQGRA